MLKRGPVLWGHDDEPQAVFELRPHPWPRRGTHRLFYVTCRDVTGRVVAGLDLHITRRPKGEKGHSFSAKTFTKGLDMIHAYLLKNGNLI